MPFGKLSAKLLTYLQIIIRIYLFTKTPISDFMKFSNCKIMNKQENDILLILNEHSYSGQRSLAKLSGYSLGMINKSLKSLVDQGYLDSEVRLTARAKNMLKQRAPRNAIILAAGFGLRMVPINMDTPKALLKVHGEVLIERLIRQLHEAGVTDITVVVGFMKEQFEYLIDEFNVKLVVNMEYASRNNLHTLFIASDRISNTYIVPCDLWLGVNPFRSHELYSWYMVNDTTDPSSIVRVNRGMELVNVPAFSNGNGMIGIAYITGDPSIKLREKLASMDKDVHFNNSFWEEALFESGRMFVNARIIDGSQTKEINTYEELRETDERSDHLRSEVIDTIAKALNTASHNITDISVLKKGMTNRSFLFSCEGSKFIMRIPGEGTEHLINRQNEANVYQAIKDRKLSDDIFYINPNNGYKITLYREDSRTCNPNDEDDLRLCMDKLREFHQYKLKVPHMFDIFATIEFYESLWPTHKSVYKDYETVKNNVYKLRDYINKNAEEYCLTHIDAIPDNFLILDDGEVRLIDWEYSGMQDPHVDIAMFAIYSLYDRKAVDRLIDIYFKNRCPHNIRIKIYCYISACGLLWSNWCEYKRSLGIEFGEYSLRQYRYAKEYYESVKTEIGRTV